MSKFRKFPRITLLNQVIRYLKQIHDYKGKDENGNNIYSHTTPYNKYKLVGRVKLHGTNGAICYDVKKDVVFFQNRTIIINVLNDNFGMANFFTKHLIELKEVLKSFNAKDYVYMYGEWCGKGIQKTSKVSIGELEKRFVIFETVVDETIIENDYVNMNISIDNINHYPKHEIEVDLNNPHAITNEITEYVLAYEKECPYAKENGVIGLGEGLVYTSIDDPSLKFKAKGKEHSVTKVKTIVPIDIEVLNSIQEFVEYACTENRLRQGLENVELDIKKTGEFIGWVARDIIKEESLTLSESNLTWKQVSGSVATKAREFFLLEYNDNL